MKMKTKHITLIFALLLIIIGCKPKQIVKEHYTVVTDSTEVVNLTKQLQNKTDEVTTLKAEINKAREENTKLQSELTTHIINYDTTANLNPDGKYPISQEIISTSKQILEQKLQENETTIAEYKKEVANLMNENSVLEYQLKMLQESENKTETKTPKQTPKLKYILWLIGIAILIYAGMKLKR